MNRKSSSRYTHAQHDQRFAEILTRWMVGEYEHPSIDGKFAAEVADAARDLSVKLIFSENPEEVAKKLLDLSDPHDKALFELAKHIRQDSGY